MRILLLSDVHGDTARARRLRSVERDVTVVSGDLADCGGSVEDAVEVLEELASQGPPVVWVPGNCDPPGIVEVKPPRNTYLVHAASVDIDGVRYAGAGGSPYTPFGTPFEMSDDELGELLSQGVAGVPEGARLVIVTHAPPYMSGLDRLWTGDYVGSRSVRRVIESARPLLHACGHIHEAWGAAVVGSALAVNPGPLVQGRYAVASLDAERGTVVARLYSI